MCLGCTGELSGTKFPREKSTLMQEISNAPATQAETQRSSSFLVARQPGSSNTLANRPITSVCCPHAYPGVPRLRSCPAGLFLPLRCVASRVPLVDLSVSPRLHRLDSLFLIPS